MNNCTNQRSSRESVELRNQEVKEMQEIMLRVQDVAAMIGVSIQTINLWYRWKKENPEHEMAKILPDFTRLQGQRRTRYWKISDVTKLEEFHNKIHSDYFGYHGIMGSVTQRYVNRNKDGRGYIDKAVNLLLKNNVDAEMVSVIREFLDEEFDKRNAA